MPLEFFRDILQEHFSDEEVRRQIETALNWGRYGEIFTYDSESDRLLLYEAAVSEELSRGRWPSLSPPDRRSRTALTGYRSASRLGDLSSTGTPQSLSGPAHRIRGALYCFMGFLADPLLGGPGRHASCDSSSTRPRCRNMHFLGGAHPVA